MSGRRLSVSWLFVLAAAIAAVGVLAIVAAALHGFPPPSFGSPVNDARLALRPAPIAGAGQVGQAFVAPLPGLYRVQIGLQAGDTAGPAPGTAQAAPLTFHLLAGDPPGAAEIWTAACSLVNLAGQPACNVEFPPLPDSRGRRYFFYLAAGAGSDDPAQAQAWTVGYGPAAVLTNAGAYLDDRPLPGNLQFTTYYQLNTPQKIDLLLTRLAAGRPGLLGVKAFYAILVTVYALTLGVVVAWLSQKNQPGNELAQQNRLIFQPPPEIRPCPPRTRSSADELAAREANSEQQFPDRGQGQDE